MTPTLKQRILEWVCRKIGHKNEYSHIYAGKKHYNCKRCREFNSVTLTWQERIILERIEELENEKTN